MNNKGLNSYTSDSRGPDTGPTSAEKSVSSLTSLNSPANQTAGSSTTPLSSSGRHFLFSRSHSARRRILQRAPLLSSHGSGTTPAAGGARQQQEQAQQLDDNSTKNSRRSSGSSTNNIMNSRHLHHHFLHSSHSEKPNGGVSVNAGTSTANNTGTAAMARQSPSNGSYRPYYASPFLENSSKTKSTEKSTTKLHDSSSKSKTTSAMVSVDDDPILQSSSSLPNKKKQQLELSVLASTRQNTSSSPSPPRRNLHTVQSSSSAANRNNKNAIRLEERQVQDDKEEQDQGERNLNRNGNSNNKKNTNNHSSILEGKHQEPGTVKVDRSPVANAHDGGEGEVDDAEVDEDEHHGVETVVGLPNETELCLLCLDYLRDLRRSYPPAALQHMEGIDADYLTVACWALQRALVAPPHLVYNPNSTATGNDAFVNPLLVEQQDEQNPTNATAEAGTEKGALSTAISLRKGSPLPGLDTMERELQLSVLPKSGAKIGSMDTVSMPVAFQYDDSHGSNSHRFYPLQGLAGGPTLAGPLTLGEICAAGLAGLGGQSRQFAELNVVQVHPLFEQFVQAVADKGFFSHDNDDDDDNENDDNDDGSGSGKDKKIAQGKESAQQREELYNSRYAKVVAKFRSKLASKAHAETVGDLVSLSVADQQRKRRTWRIQQAAAVGAIGYEEEKTDSEPSDINKCSSGVLGATLPPSALSLVKYDGDGGDEDDDDDDNDHAAAANTSRDTISEAANGESRPSPSNSFLHTAHLASRLFFCNSGDNMETPPANGGGNGATPPANDNGNGATGAAGSEVLDIVPSVADVGDNPADIAEAERCKSEGNAHMQRKEFEEAIACYTEALKFSPSGPQSHVYYSNRAAALVSQKRFYAAIADSERSLSLNPTYGKAHARLGLAHFLLGDYHRAKEAYTVALKYEPNNKSSKNYLERSLRKLAEEDERKRTTAIVGLDVQTAFSNSSGLEKLHYHNNNNSNIKQQYDEKEADKCKAMGNAFMASRQYLDAYDAYTKAIQLSPPHPQAGSGSQLHVYYSNRAASLCYLERYKEAEEDSLKSLEINPTYGKAHARLGLSRYFLKDYQGAVEAYSAALEHDPENAASRSYLAKAKARLVHQKHHQQQHQQQQQLQQQQQRLEITTTPTRGKSNNNRGIENNISFSGRGHTGSDGSTNEYSPQHSTGTSSLSSSKPRLTTGGNVLSPSSKKAAMHRLMDDPNFRKVAGKAMSTHDKSLLDDPDMKSIAKKAMADPTLRAAFGAK